MLEQEQTQPKPLSSSNPQTVSKKRWFLWGAGLGGLALGGITSAVFLVGPAKLPFLDQWFGAQLINSGADLEDSRPSTSTLALASVSPTDRAIQLEELANQGTSSLDRARARYLRAVDLIEQDRGGQALPWLDGLEHEYDVLAPHILAKRAQAQAATGDAAKAQATWQALVKQYPNHPKAAEALFHLGKTNSAYWDRMIADHPSHPRSVEIAVNRLQQNPKQLDLMRLLARHGVYLPDIGSVLDRLRTDYGGQLTPDDWEAIGFAYWEIQRYGSAAEAYAKAPPSAINLYRAARGAQLDARGTVATTRYQALVQAFPSEKETGLALLKLAELEEKPDKAIAYLDQVINTFPDRTAEALMAKANILQAANSPQTALQIQQQVLKEHSGSEFAADLRWQQAEANFKKGDIQAAWEWARQLAQENPDSVHAPEAAFWVGKWAAQLGRTDEARQSYEYVLANYPGSYYAWRSAVLLGWDVGDFSTVRQKTPEVERPATRPEPLAGSAALRELYLLGQTRDAWSLWQVEHTDRVQPTVAQQFTDGLIRLGVNDNLDGIFMLSNLSFREQPDEKQEVAALKHHLDYWQALYPFPYLQSIEQWSQQRQLNPMLVTALIRQESRFEPKIRSVVGATGLMQVMPETAEWVANQINLKQYNLEDPQDNINLGTWYLDFTHREYNNNSLFAVASYNAGPGSVADWINRFGFNDPDKFVEEIPFPETKGYVEAVFENYWNYLRLYNPTVSEKLAQFSKSHANLVNSRLGK
ncbi:lytic transglycosylase domain-containing protein [Thermocoleostomius sinensis]|uniref:Transglycosylase SLT domain-containing protein n=1 Tax=Thermocoleostomius sinensis A174 TaxID=2016057 RepID=A0A9E8ZG49_9CYAN|nr:transglycosylase SLT domain-containing protein [Thermocoleostomius sinensis]WAL60728.1 transglycosylase SLT domain-containing protein [Thermocoleostomius sinensis A174]